MMSAASSSRPKVMNSSTKMIASVAGMTIFSRSVARSRYSNWPDQAIETPGVSLRSEEHTSELQSLMRTSYAVFCLQKKRHTRNGKQEHSIPDETKDKTEEM